MEGVPLTKLKLALILAWVLCFEQQERIQAVDRTLHDGLHLVIANTREAGVAAAGRARTARVNVLNGSIPKCEGDNGFGLAGNLAAVFRRHVCDFGTIPSEGVDRSGDSIDDQRPLTTSSR